MKQNKSQIPPTSATVAASIRMLQFLVNKSVFSDSGSPIHHLPSAADDPAVHGGGTNQELRRRPRPKQWPATLWLAVPHQMKLCNTQSKVV